MYTQRKTGSDLYLHRLQKRRQNILNRTAANFSGIQSALHFPLFAIWCHSKTFKLCHIFTVCVLYFHIRFEVLTALLLKINPLNPELNPICHLLALLGADHFLHFSRIRAKLLTFRLRMSYMYMEHPFLMFLDHTQRRSTVGRTPLDE